MVGVAPATEPHTVSPSTFRSFPPDATGTHRCEIWEDEGEITWFRSILHFWVPPAVQTRERPIKTSSIKKDNAQGLVKTVTNVATPRQAKQTNDLLSTGERKGKERQTTENGNKESGNRNRTDYFKLKPSFVSDLEEAKNNRTRRTFRASGKEEEGADDTISRLLRIHESSVSTAEVLHSNSLRGAGSTAATTPTFETGQGSNTFKGNPGQIPCDQNSTVHRWQFGGVSSKLHRTDSSRLAAAVAVAAADADDDSGVFRGTQSARQTTAGGTHPDDKGERHEWRSIKRADADRDCDRRTVSPVTSRVLSGVSRPAAVAARWTVTTTPDFGVVAAPNCRHTNIPTGDYRLDARPLGERSGVKLLAGPSQVAQGRELYSYSLSDTQQFRVSADRDTASGAYRVPINTDCCVKNSSGGGGICGVGGGTVIVAVSPNGTLVPSAAGVYVVVDKAGEKVDVELGTPPCGLLLPVTKYYGCEPSCFVQADVKFERDGDVKRQQCESCPLLQENSRGFPFASPSVFAPRYHSALVREQRRVVDCGLVSLLEPSVSDSARNTSGPRQDVGLPYKSDSVNRTIKDDRFGATAFATVPTRKARGETSPAGVRIEPVSCVPDSVHTKHSPYSKGVGKHTRRSESVQVKPTIVKGVQYQPLHSDDSRIDSASFKEVRHSPLHSESVIVDPFTFKGGEHQSLRFKSVDTVTTTHNRERRQPLRVHIEKSALETLPSQPLQTETTILNIIENQPFYTKTTLLHSRQYQPIFDKTTHTETTAVKTVRHQHQQPLLDTTTNNNSNKSSMIPMEVSESVAIVTLPNYAEHSFESAVHFSDMRRHKSTVNFEPVLAPVRFADTMYLWGKDTTKKRYVSRTFYEPRVKPKKFGETDFVFPKDKTERFASFVDYHIDECRKWFKTCVELKARTFTTVHTPFAESSTVTSSSASRRDVTVNGAGDVSCDGPGASQVFIPPHKVGDKALGEKQFRVAVNKDKVDINMNGPIANGF